MPPVASQSVKVNPGRIRLVLLWAVIVMAVLVSVVAVRKVAMGWVEQYPIKQINVVGDLKYVDQQTLEAALKPYVSDSFFSVDLDKVKQTAESLTWIDYADARKEWPDTLIVLLHERVPVANWGKNRFLSKKGEIFSAEHVQPDVNLPTFIGKPEQAPVLAERFEKMQKILNGIGLSVKQLELEDRVSWKAQLNNGLELVVDEKNSLEKVKRFAQLYNIFTDEQKLQLSRVDLRYENGLAIKWKKNDGDTDAA